MVEVLYSDWLTQGSKVREFKSGLAAYFGGKHAVVFSFRTTTLQAAYFAAGIGVGEEIVTSPLTRCVPRTPSIKCITPVHLQPYYRDRGLKPGLCPWVEAYSDSVLGIPIAPRLTEKECTAVVREVKRAISENLWAKTVV